MKTKSRITLLVTLVLIVLVGLLAFNGIGHIFGTKYGIMPVAERVSLGLDLRGGVYAVYLGHQDANTDAEFKAKLDSTVTIIRNRLTAKGFTEATISLQGADRIRVEIPDVEDPNEILNIIGTPARLSFLDPEGNVVITGEDISLAAPARNSSTGEYVVSFELNESGKEAFAEATRNNIGKAISIVLDDTTISSPTVQSAITEGRGEITGMGGEEAAFTLAGLIMSGALPLDIEMIESSLVSATLGVEALDSAVLAALIGLALIFLFMIVLYRIPGVVSCMALCIYMIIVAYCVALIPGVQLTLPGIAGLLLGVGMAVDGNVIIFERFRQELKAGHGLEVAVKRGYKNALSSIIDSNVTTIIAAVVLAVFGTGSIKGFALTLLIGVVVSMISSVFVTRFLLLNSVRIGVTKRSLFTR